MENRIRGIVTARSWSDARIGLEFGSEQSYQMSEEGNRIGLGFNLCVALTCTICRYVLQFWDGHRRPELDRGWTEVGTEVGERSSSRK